ncbi:flagellar protein MotY [Pseudomonas sp.]|uniref:flagellar protein MotY n=1 Tax=Pseudomonas sp. TaxID=306 RepID=UPI00272B761C|nr:OmpA family protein [Pseudomonas sp.]
MVRLAFLLLSAVVLPAQALTFQTRMEDVAWTVEGDQFECRLSQTVSGYGEAVFLRRAGERPIFQLKAWSNLMQPGQAQLYNDTPPWRPGSRTQMLGTANVLEGPIVIRVPQQQAGQMLAGLAEGLHPTIQRASWANTSTSVRVVVSSVGYQKAWQDFQSCSAKLLPMNIDQISRTAISFASGGTALSPGASAMLDVVLEYLAADQSIGNILLEGHSDNVGDRLTNRELSRQRVLTVQRYLVERGIAEDRFTLRFHGDRYPVASNATPDGRARNRRVMLSLERL